MPKTRIVKTRTSQSALFLSKIAVVRKLGDNLSLDGTLSEEERAKARKAWDSAPDALIEGIASLASEHGGVLVGVPIDADEVRQSIAYGAAAKPFARALRELARRTEDTALVKRAAAASQAFAALRSLGAVQGTPQGEPFAKEYDELRRIARAARGKPRKAAKKDGVKTDAPVNEAQNGGGVKEGQNGVAKEGRNGALPAGAAMPG